MREKEGKEEQVQAYLAGLVMGQEMPQVTSHADKRPVQVQTSAPLGNY